MFGIHLFVQLCCFVVVFLMLCARPAPADAARARAASARAAGETYPFRVGLIDALLAEFRAVLWIHPTRGPGAPAAAPALPGRAAAGTSS